MPPLASLSADAEAAARQAEFNEKKWVWVPDEREGYLAGWVLREEGEEGEVQMAFNSEIRRVPLYALSKMNPPKFDRVDDIADLTFLNEASVVHNLRLRYGSGAIYTYSGLFLVAVNPYQHLPLYSDAIVAQYRGKRRDENPPHIFAIAERAWVHMGEERENQSILITGESGAGKTESTKKVIQYLAAIATDAHPPTPGHGQTPSLGSPATAFEAIMPATGLPRTESFRNSGQTRHGKSTSLSASASSSQLLSSSKSRLGLLERQILQANPILEAFGNAQTQRNNNSSRFGKFIRISFAPDGSIAGANIDWYLLEKSRVVVRNEAERSFHVFYQLMEAGGGLKDELLLDGHVEDYEFLNKSRREVDGINDAEEWRLLKQALDTVGLTEVEQFDLFRIVAAVLHIGNIEITATRSGDALMPDPSQAERACHLLGIPIAEFTKAVLRPRVLAGREWVSNARTRRQAMDELASLSKTLYEKSFGLLVERINRALDRPSSKSTFIGVLDIAGFEIFDINGYEQLLINYTNEKLQQFFNHHMFVLEQEEYTREGIEWDYVNFGQDLQPTIDLIEATGATIGILSCIDEECIMPGATDLTFTNKLHQLWSAELPPGDEPHPGHYKYEPSRFDQGFLVQHYAGKVEYRTDGWLEKNKDPLNDNLTRVIAASTERYVAACFAEYADGALTTGPSVSALASGVFGTGGGGRRMVKKGAFRTVAQRHKEQLASLMAQLMATQPHFVRCIVPNGLKKPARIDAPLVLDQLRCNGVLEGIRIARLGYPNRLPFVEFRQRYEVLTPGILPRGYMDGRKACLRMVDALELDNAIFKIGTSKIFFKAGVLAELEERRDALLFDIFARFQAMARRRTARRQIKKILNRAIAIRTIQRNARQYNQLREWPWWQLYTKVRPLLAATRNDEELQKKELELALARERAERDKQERDALESLKMRLEAEKQKVEDKLTAERALALDKDSLLSRSKQRESELETYIAELEKEIADMKDDIDIMDSQLEQALKLRKENEEKHEHLKEAFGQAAEHLVRLESEQSEWNAREAELTEQYNEVQTEADALRASHFEQQKSIEELKNLIIQKEEDLQRAKDRMETAVAELDRKLVTESTNRELLKEKSDTLEFDLRQAKEQLAEMTRTATEYSNMIDQKEAALERMGAELDASKEERERMARRVIELQGEIDTLAGELEAQKSDRIRGAAARERLQSELDDLRATLREKDSEDTRKDEAAKSMEVELVELRTQSRKLQQDISDARRQALESNNKLKVELESAQREHASVQRSYDSLLVKEREASSKLIKTEAALSEAEKARRTLESELHVIRSRQVDMDRHLEETQRAKEVFEKQLMTSQARQADFEDVVLQLEREKSALDRQIELLRNEFDAETAKRAQLEKALSTQKMDLVSMKDRNVKLDRELNKALKDIKDLEWQNKQLVSKQDKTIVEHVHVLEEAKRVTDKQLKDAKLELDKQVAYIRSLEKAKTRLANEAEDLTRETELERREIQKREKELRIQQERAARAVADVDKERHAKEAAELHNRKLQADLQSSRSFADELQDQLALIQRSKANLESELTKLADETRDNTSVAKMQRQYEARIAELENEVHDAKLANSTAARIKDRIDQQHAEIRRLILNDGPKDDAFRNRLLRELQFADEQMAQELGLRPRSASSAEVRTMGNMSPSKREGELNGKRHRTSSHPDAPPASDRQANALRQQLQVMEIQMATSDRVRQHLEASLRDMTSDLDNTDGSKQYLERTRARLSKENARLAELLEEEAETRRAAEAAQKDGVQSLWQKFQNTMAHEQESYSRLEESRKALLVQQRAAQAELEDYRRQLHEVTQSKKHLQAEIADLQDRLNAETAKRNEESAMKRQMQHRLQELEITISASSSMHGDLSEAVESFKEKANTYQAKLEEAEIARAKASRAESFARRQLADLEKSQAEVVSQRNQAEKHIAALEDKIHELEARLDEEGRDASQMEVLRVRLAEEMEDERNQHRQDIEERDFNIESMRKKYQGELAQLSEELQAQRDSMSRLREENRTLRSDYDELQLRHDDEVYSGGAWKKEKERFETRIADLNQAYETSMAAQAEQQSQIVGLHSQVRELRAVLNDAEAERVLLQKARRALQAELESIKLDHVDSSKLSSATEMQKLQLKKQDLERSLEEKEERVALANERLKKAEGYANECQIELGKVRVENSELDKLNANLEKQIKELNLRIVDLETRASLSTASRPAPSSRKMESRIEELTNQLHQTSRDKSETQRAQRSADKTLADERRLRLRAEEEVGGLEQKIQNLRGALDELQTSESNLKLTCRRAEREAADYKQKTLSLEREVERLRGRSRPPTMIGSPTGSPRKFPS